MLRPDFLRRGHAPFVDIGDYKSSTNKMQERFYKALEVDGMDVTNHSYVQSFTAYDAIAADLDTIVRGDATTDAGQKIPARPQVWAAGNNGTSSIFDLSGGVEEGYTSVFTSAKNTISVGSVDSLNGRLSSFSSLNDRIGT